MSRTEAIPMAPLPSLGLAVPNPWSSKPQFESYISRGYEADTENDGRTSAKKHKEQSWLHYFDPMDQKSLSWSWPDHVQYQDTWAQGTSSKTASQTKPLAQKVKDHTSLVDGGVRLPSDTAEKEVSQPSQMPDPPPCSPSIQLNTPFHIGSHALEKHSERFSLPDLETSLSHMDEYEDLTFEPGDRPSPMPFLRANRECFTGEFKHYCAGDMDDEAAKMAIGIPMYSPIGNGNTTRVFVDGDGGDGEGGKGVLKVVRCEGGGGA